jgi:hypothetical protein
VAAGDQSAPSSLLRQPAGKQFLPVIARWRAFVVLKPLSLIHSAFRHVLDDYRVLHGLRQAA